MAQEELSDCGVDISSRNAGDALDLSIMKKSDFKKNNTIKIVITVTCVRKV